ncbi:MAG: PAS domain S-box protein [Gemmatimonadetes bacterium]|nr:PAS domain S-box protein [Gemmatimonadota bacterium]
MPHLLLFLAGANASIAVLHFWTGARDRPNWARHLPMGGVAASLAAYVALSAMLFEASTLEAYQTLAVLQGAVSVVLVAVLWWFVAHFTGVRPLPLLWAATALSAAALVANVVSPAGIFYGEITALQRVDIPSGGSVTLPAGTANPLQRIFDAAVLGLAAFAVFACARQYRRGVRRDTFLLGAAALAAAVPSFIDIFVLGPRTFAIPWTEVGLSLTLVVLSIGITDGAVLLARAERARQASERRARALVDGAPDGIVIVDPAATPEILEINPAGRRLLGLEEGAAPPGLVEIMPERQPGGGTSAELGRPLLEAAAAGEARTTRWTFRRADGSSFPGEVWLTPLADEDGRPLVRVSFLDIGERLDAEERERRLTHVMNQRQRLETLGTLAGGIAHDFNNLLTPILGNVEMALLDLEPSSPARHYLEEVRQAADRARELVQQILLFSRRAHTRPGTSTLAGVVRGTLRLVQSGYPGAVTISTDLEVDGRVAVDATYLHQVVMNLATNAVQAMPRGGTLHVSTGRAEPRDGEGPLLVLTVSDTGPGIPPPVLDRIFDPFFTTKAPGDGTGLGLSTVHGIVTAAGGRVEVESAEGEGTTFRVLLPEVPDAPPIPPSRA